MDTTIDAERGLVGEAEMEALRESGLLGEPELEERSIPSIDLEMYGSHFGDISEDYHTTPIEPEDGIIAFPLAAQGISSEEEEAEPVIDEEKKSILKEIRRSLTDFADKFPRRQVVRIEEESRPEIREKKAPEADVKRDVQGDKILEGIKATVDAVSKIAEQLAKSEPPVINIENVIPESKSEAPIVNIENVVPEIKSEPPVVNIENVMPEMPIKMDVTVQSPDEVLETETITHRGKDGFIRDKTSRTTRK